MKTMKYLLLLSCFLPIFSCGHGHDNKRQKGDPVAYHYSYWGMMAQPVKWYEVQKEDDGTVTLSYASGSSTATVYKAPADLLQKIGATARQYKLHKLSSSYRPVMEILDGNSWSMHISYPEGSISSGGSNAGAGKKLMSGIATINQNLQSLIDNASPEDVIGERPIR